VNSGTTRKSFHEELASLEATLLGSGELVQRSLELAVEALKTREPVLSQVIAIDDEVDRRYQAIEEGILALLARQSPVAGDLRLVAAMLHVNLHLERIGDLSVNIAKFVEMTREYVPSPEILQCLQDMGARAREMVGQALKAFAERDLSLALELPSLDEPIDELNRKVFDLVIGAARDPALLEWASRIVLVSRFLERVADQAVDIGEQVGFLVTGEVRQFEVERGMPDAATGRGAPRADPPQGG
jgi:phosphate transport system protein